jgi:hypothetical protein
MTAVALLSPEGDKTEQVMGQWSASLASILSGDPRYTVLSDARGAVVCQANLAQQVNGADAVLYFGHGKPDHLGNPVQVMTAQDGPTVAHLAIGGMACHAGARLGHDLVNQSSARGFLGFDDQFCVYLANPSVFGSVITAALRELLDPASTGDAALKVLKDGFHHLRFHYQAVERDPTATQRQRYAAHEIWMASYPNELTAVWIAPSAGGTPGQAVAGDHEDDSGLMVYA